MTPDLRQEAIQQVVRQRNPFHAKPFLKLRRRGLQRLWHHPQIHRYRIHLGGFVFSATERLSKYVVVITALFVGFVLAAAFITLPLSIALYLLDFNLAELSFRLVTEQNWSNYSSWLLISSTLFCLPYWCWGLPLALSWRCYHSIHHWYTRGRLRRQLQNIHCDDPAYLSTQIAQHPLMTGQVRPSQWVEWWLEKSGKAAGAITGTLATLLCLILCLKLLFLLWQQGESWQSVAIFLSCPAAIYLPFLLFRSYRSGQAVADLVMDLLGGISYREAMMVALDDFWMELFEGL